LQSSWVWLGSQTIGWWQCVDRRLDRMQTDVLDVDTASRRMVDLTDAVRRFCFSLGDGLCNVFVPHATAGVAIIETGAGSDDDLVDTLERLLPRDDRYRHSHGSAGHGADHVLPAIVAPSVMVPVSGGELQLGTWQSIVLVDLNRDNPRRSVRLSFLGG
jgi:secondary thiamine-phosphate synthase enzyme